MLYSVLMNHFDDTDDTPLLMHPRVVFRHQYTAGCKVGEAVLTSSRISPPGDPGGRRWGRSSGPGPGSSPGRRCRRGSRIPPTLPSGSGPTRASGRALTPPEGRDEGACRGVGRYGRPSGTYCSGGQVKRRNVRGAM